MFYTFVCIMMLGFLLVPPPPHRPKKRKRKETSVPLKQDTPESPERFSREPLAGSMLGGTPSQASHRTGKGGPNDISPVFSRNWKLRNSSCNQIPPPSISIEKEKGESGNNVCSKGTIACWFPRCIKLLAYLRFHLWRIHKASGGNLWLAPDLVAVDPSARSV